VILRRLARNLREQNWTAITIEFVLLVLGVFMGIQVANWNEARNLQQRRAAALERMHGEIEANIDYLQRRIAVLTRDADARNEAFRRLMANDWAGADPARMATAFDTTGFAPALSPPKGVYDELISTGMFAELGNPRLRDRISAYYSYIEYVQGQVDYVRSGIVANSAGRTFRGVSMVFDPDADRQIRTQYDLRALGVDAEFISTKVQENAALLAQVQWTTDALTRAMAACAEIARVAGRTCHPGEGGRS
jgi:hypothetical protein